MDTIKINPTPLHSISPYLYMQFMEPLGMCDASMDAGWDFFKNEWKPFLIEKVRQLGPKMVRFGGCFASYYHWYEAVGPRANRIPILNQDWEALYHNQMGTAEVIDFCRQVAAEPLIVVNMESDGRMHWAYPECGGNRLGTAQEAADWVAYCNHPNHPLRLSHGVTDPYNVRYWQLGNETSYDKRGFTADQCVEVTKRFVEKMRTADDSIHLIGWGDVSKADSSWTQKMSQLDGIDLLAFHHHFDSGLPDSPLTGNDYRIDPDKTWHHLIHAHRSLQDHIDAMRSQCGQKRLAITEGHYNLPGRNRNEVLSTWGAGVSYARCLNVIHRNSDIIDIATMADFFGTVWQVNAILLTGRKNKMFAYFQPVASVMQLFSHHQGEYALGITTTGHVDATASRTGNTLYLHLINTDKDHSACCKLSIENETIQSIRMFAISDDPMTEVTPCNPDVFAPKEIPVNADIITLAPAAVAAIEITLA